MKLSDLTNSLGGPCPGTTPGEPLRPPLWPLNPRTRRLIAGSSLGYGAWEGSLVTQRFE